MSDEFDDLFIQETTIVRDKPKSNDNSSKPKRTNNNKPKTQRKKKSKEEIVKEITLKVNNSILIETLMDIYKRLTGKSVRKPKNKLIDLIVEELGKLKNKDSLNSIKTFEEQVKIILEQMELSK